jgi:hypothetical protein
MIAIITCLNNRPHISPLIFECAKRLNRDQIYTHLIVGYSSAEDEKLAVEWSVECPWVHPVGPIDNVPGFKWNEVLKYAYNSVSEFKGFIIMGDDDSMSDEYFNAIMTFAPNDYIGTNINGFIEQKTGKALKHRYEMKNKLIGAGRYVSRHAIEKTCVRQPIIMKRLLVVNGVSYQQGSRECVEVSVANYLCSYGYAQRSGEVMFLGLWRTKQNKVSTIIQNSILCGMGLHLCVLPLMIEFTYPTLRATGMAHPQTFIRFRYCHQVDRKVV